MNNRFILSLCVCFLVGMGCLAKTENLSKTAQKSYKKACKQLKADGWKVYGKVLSLDKALMQYYQLLGEAGENIQEVIGTGQDRNVNKAYSKARISVSKELASMKGIKVEGQTIVQMYETIADSTEAGTLLVSNTHTKIEQAITPIPPVLSLYRTQKDGTTEIKLFYNVIRK